MLTFILEWAENEFMTQKHTFSAQDMAAVARAAHHAAVLHSSQVRMSVKRVPYVNHLAEVAMLVAEHGGDAAAIQAAYLHDSVEDTQATLADIEALFGPEVAGLVAELTDDKSMPRLEQKRTQVASMPGKSWRARLIKIADQTSNCTSVAIDPAPKWSNEHCIDYALKCKAVVDAGRGTSPSLEARFDEAFRMASERLGIEDGAAWTATAELPVLS